MAKPVNLKAWFLVPELEHDEPFAFGGGVGVQFRINE